MLSNSYEAAPGQEIDDLPLQLVFRLIFLAPARTHYCGRLVAAACASQIRLNQT